MASTYMEIPRYNSCAPVKPPVLNSMISIGNNHAVFLIQFGINLHEWVFQKAEIARAPSASAISAFWKTHKCKLIPNWTRKTVWLLINNTIMKKFVRSKCFHDISWRHFFFTFEKAFFKDSVQNLCHCFTWYHWPKKILIVFLQIRIQNYDV